MPYVSNTEDDRRRMLDALGVKSIDGLLSSIPPGLQFNRPLRIDPLSEMDLLNEVRQMSQENQDDLICFAGGGVYQHFIPTALSALLSRPEFMTAYTPYQAEVAQGTLQVIYEFQTHICRLTGMDIANASMYDGATAAAEAIKVASTATRRRKVVIAQTVNPLYREVIRTYLSGKDIEPIYVPFDGGVTDPGRLADLIDDSTAGVLVAQPNFFGCLEDIETIAEGARKVGARLIMSVDPVAQALLKTPGDYGADIVVGEGQPLGIPLSYGGPLLGFMAARKELARTLPGRIAARTKDADGRTGFVLTLQTREQHIRREKATSNICTNQALCATAAAIYLSLMGKSGLKQVALLSAERAQQTARDITAVDGVELWSQHPFVREFTVKLPLPAAEIVRLMVKRHRVLPGIDAGRWYQGMEDCLIVATTELRSQADIKRYIDGLKELTASGVLSRM